MSRLPASRRSRRSAGYSLIELLVAMAIALFLLGGLLTIVQSTRNTYTAQTALATLQDNERLAMILATDVIQAAGYFPDPTTNELVTALPVVPGQFPTAGQSITGTSGGGAPGDSISVRFRTASDDTILNCAGGTNKTGADVTYVNTFSVDAQGNLDCTLSTNGAVAAPVPLVSGIKDLQIWYGVATTGVDDNVDTYLTAAEVTAKNDWQNVTSVKVRLTFTNPLAAQQPGRPTTNYIESVVGVMSRIGAST
ncbi:MAG: PilW family protein [Steroidobacteraceae bacterium]